MRNISGKSCRENQKGYFAFNYLYFPGNFAVYEKMWKNILEPGMPLIII